MKSYFFASLSSFIIFAMPIPVRSLEGCDFEDIVVGRVGCRGRQSYPRRTSRKGSVWYRLCPLYRFPRHCAGEDCKHRQDCKQDGLLSSFSCFSFLSSVRASYQSAKRVSVKHRDASAVLFDETVSGEPVDDAVKRRPPDPEERRKLRHADRLVTVPLEKVFRKLPFGAAG